MNIEIEVYKGQSITYNDDNDKFECEMELSGKVRGAKRGSLKDLRKEIDQFVKTNLEFKPFRFLKKSDYSDKTFLPCYCSAIRTDGKFVVYREGNENYKSYWSKKEMALAMAYDADVMKELEALDEQDKERRVKYTKDVAALYDKLTPCDLSAYQIES